MNYSNPKKIWNKIEDSISSVILGIALIILFIQVVLRFGFGKSIPQLEEYSIYIFVWYTFLTSSDAMRCNSHIRVEAVVNLLPAKVKSIVYLLTQVLNLVFSVIFTYSGIQIVINRLALATTSTTGFPMWIVWLAIPLCMGLSSIRSLQYIYFTIKYELLGKPLPEYINTDIVEIDGVEFSAEEDNLGGDQ